MAVKKTIDNVVRAQVTRSFFWEGKAVAVGTILDLPRNFALGAIASNKAKALAPAPEPEPEKDPAPAAKKGGK